jgi:quinol monooxygenase YgiN
MTIEYIRYRIPVEQAQAFVSAYQRAAESLRASHFCLGYELSQCVEEPSAFVLRIEWTSGDDHLKGFRKSSEFQAFFREIRPYVDNIDEMRHYERSELVWQREAAPSRPAAEFTVSEA